MRYPARVTVTLPIGDGPGFMDRVFAADRFIDYDDAFFTDEYPWDDMPTLPVLMFGGKAYGLCNYGHIHTGGPEPSTWPPAISVDDPDDETVEWIRRGGWSFTRVRHVDDEFGPRILTETITSEVII